ncbi:hypothetical protein OH77DRAFT_1519529 [Trametes cingulata]|nr:hypothetical protein OH77DRAFT_1519529 [Trametes cingulata]
MGIIISCILDAIACVADAIMTVFAAIVDCLECIFIGPSSISALVSLHSNSS